MCADAPLQGEGGDAKPDGPQDRGALAIAIPAASVRLRAQRKGASLQLVDLGTPVQVQVHDGRSRPDRRLVILNTLHHENRFWR
jgi:hypothetical protein